MTYLTGIAALDITGGAPNNGRGKDNLAKVKAATLGYDRIPYISAQAFRRWLRDSLPAGEQHSPVHKTGTGKKQQSYTSGRPDLHLDDDLFGYMIATKGHNYQRDTVLAVGKFMALTTQRISTDFGVMNRGLPAGSDPLIHEHEHYTSELVGDLLLDVPRIGTLEQNGTGIRKPCLSPDAAKQAQTEGATPRTLRHQECLALPMAERRRRAATLLRTMATMQGGAKNNVAYGDRTPSLILLAPLKGANNPFTRVLRAGPVTLNDPGTTQFDTDVFQEEYRAWEDEIEGAVRIGWSPGFLGGQREKVREELAPYINDGCLVIDHPRVVMNTLAKEIEAGQYDHWFDDAA